MPNAISAISSEPSLMSARLEKNLPTALKKLEMSPPSEARGTLLGYACLQPQRPPHDAILERRGDHVGLEHDAGQRGHPDGERARGAPGGQGLGFTLLADEDHAVCERYGVWAEKSMYGRTYMGALRATFIIDAEGTVARVFPKVSPKTHDDVVLKALSELSGAAG